MKSRERRTTRCCALVDVGGVPTLLWKLIEEIRPDDYAVMRAECVTAGGKIREAASISPAGDDVPGLARFVAHRADPDVRGNCR